MWKHLFASRNILLLASSITVSEPRSSITFHIPVTLGRVSRVIHTLWTKSGSTSLLNFPIEKIKKRSDMDTKELTELVTATSLTLMNKGKGDGTIYACYDEDEILAVFSGLTKAQVVAKVAKMDGATKDAYDEIMATADFQPFGEGQ